MTSNSPIKIPASAIKKQARDHRTGNSQSFVTRDSIRVTKYTPASKGYDIQQIIIMNGRGNQEQLTKGASATPIRKVRDHRDNAQDSTFHPDSMRVTSYIIPGKEKDNRPVVGMNGRGNQELLVKKSNMRKGRVSPDKARKKTSYLKAAN